MDRWLGRYSEATYAAFRFMAGAMFAMHGAQKLFGAFGSQPMTGNPMMLVAGVIEFVGGLMIAVGLLTSWAAFLASGQMAVAYFMVHAKQAPFSPLENKGELAVLYCFAFLYMASRGGGRYSVDGMRRRT